MAEALKKNSSLQTLYLFSKWGGGQGEEKGARTRGGGMREKKAGWEGRDKEVGRRVGGGGETCACGG